MSEKNMNLLGIPVIIKRKKEMDQNQEEVTILCGRKAEVIPMEIVQVAPGQFVGSIPSGFTPSLETLRDQIEKLLRENGELKRRLAVYEPEAPC